LNFIHVKNFMEKLVERGIPGNAISIRLNNREVFSSSAGYADFENKVPMSADKHIFIYSCSKIATVTAALQLYEKGFFLLDDPLYDFIPEFREMYIQSENGELKKAKNPITMRHLFTMTSGLTYNSNTEGFALARRLTNGRMDTLTTVKCIAKDPLSFEPGTSWQYSLSHDVLAGAVEAISGKKFRDYVKENIFDALDMKASMYHCESVVDDMTEQYRFVDSDETDIVKLQISRGGSKPGRVENAGKINSHIYGTEYDSGGAGIITTVSDYSGFVSALANDGIGENGNQILTKGTIDLMRTNQLDENTSAKFNWSQLKGYGYGLGVRTLVSKAQSGSNGSVGEFGWGGAAGATAIIDPERRLSVFYAHHMLNPWEDYYQPRLRNVVYTSLDSI